MIQRFTCMPTSEYDVLVLTNGSVSQVENKLQDMNEQLDNALPKHYRLRYLNSFADLVQFVDDFKADTHKQVDFAGKIFLMFFDGLEFIQNVLSDAIDYYQRCLMRKANFDFDAINCYFYFDSSIFDFGDLDFENGFNHLITIVSDVLKKMNFMVGNIKGIVLDDFDLKGEKIFPIHCLLRSYPRIERIELASDAAVVMRGLLT
ncbi:hypothetical protein CANTEDRAFT_107031 [Yamadazyma tenuis ATCC 10573]|uniref:Uncharacterized protein n=1 Tax=Candida tenuis (strain ATCC 10573 / BCRC 21748 / CBS 615 / JCM 9827 / NBRC 10315 / NRRL Y-1498 / VKM Y-70) TaxID=590646 RepID=G3B6F1_CANTC|nr:uncharacterized protein CANTEDRAFT_107031 [Yamadazyma tenuis ATCC 10573]EGV63452.1 hypothetical protein CANTEDRAFT_107031 [Yamadazyma tenuis ATCC 10573]